MAGGMTGERRKECQADSLESPFSGWRRERGIPTWCWTTAWPRLAWTAGTRLASALFYGVLERRITLDYQISRYSKMPLSQMAEPVKEILRLGFYQLLYMDKVPQSAAVNESVKLRGR